MLDFGSPNADKQFEREVGRRSPETSRGATVHRTAFTPLGAIPGFTSHSTKAHFLASPNYVGIEIMIRLGTVSSLVVVTILGGTYYLRSSSPGAFPIKMIDEPPGAGGSWDRSRNSGLLRQQPTVLSAAPDTASGMPSSQSPHSVPFRSPVMSTVEGTEASERVPLPGLGVASLSGAPEIGGRTSEFAAEELGPATNSQPGSNERLRGRLVLAPGASFWNLAERAYGSGSYFRALYAHNRDRVPSPDRVHGGEVIDIPDEGVLRQKFPELCPGALETARAGSGIYRPTR